MHLTNDEAGQLLEKFVADGFAYLPSVVSEHSVYLVHFELQIFMFK